MREKAPIALDHILKPGEDGPVRCVLVEGAPGIGKSTLAWEVCHRWEELESVKQYELVVLVRSRDKKAREARCLEELLPCDATTNMKELLAAIGRGKGVLIVCDGFDELPCEQRQEGSVYIDLIKGRLLAEATIIVTSRPSVSAELWSLCQHNTDRHLEVMGFTKEDIKQFAESVFNGDILAGFLSYITNNPPVYGMMYIPLNAVIVALIYQDSYDTDTPFPTTMTQLFDALTRALVRRHLVSTHRVSIKYRMPPSLQHTKDINKLPPLVTQQLFQLARLAYESLCDKVYIFTNLSEDFENLGVMKKTTSLNVCTGPGCSYSFLHLTLQEYLAAFHVVNVNPNSSFKQWFRTDGSTIALRFLAGMCRCNNYEFHPVYQGLVREIGNQCLVNPGLQLIHCAYECPSIMDNLSVQYSEADSLSIVPEIGFDWYVAGYCIGRFDQKWGITVGDYNMGREGIDLLIKGFMSIPKAKRRAWMQVLRIESLSPFKLIAPLRKSNIRLFRLELDRVGIQHDDQAIVQQLIVPGSGLWKLDIQFDLFPDNIETHFAKFTPFFPILFQLSSLRVVSLYYYIIGSESSYVSDSFTVTTEFLPHKNSNLEILIISSSLLRPLAASILSISSLNFLAVADLKASDLPILTSIIQSHCTLKTLQLGYRVEYRRTYSSLGTSAKTATNTETNSSASTTCNYFENLVQLIEAAGNSQLEKLVIDTRDYERLPQHIRKRYCNLLSSVLDYTLTIFLCSRCNNITCRSMWDDLPSKSL